MDAIKFQSRQQVNRSLSTSTTKNIIGIPVNRIESRMMDYVTDISTCTRFQSSIQVLPMDVVGIQKTVGINLIVPLEITMLMKSFCML